MIGGAVVVILAGFLLIWMSARMQRGRLPRNSIAGVRTKSTMRSDDAFRIANKAAAPLTTAGGVFFIAAGVAAALSPTSTAPIALLAGVLAGGALCVIGGLRGVRACR